ncbi:MAG: lysostaphin resistance A-like protein [Promethearchaeota archaeon]
MIQIKEKNGSFLNFFKASMVVALGGTLLNFLIITISLFIVFSDFSLPFDYIILNLFILFLSQFIGAFMIYFVFIPLFKAKDAENPPFTLFNSFRTILLICVTLTIVVSINFILYYVFGLLDLNPQSGYTTILLSLEHLANPLNILIYYLPLTIGAAVYEELIYRRLLIPLLEQRGMSPSPAVLSSSLLFALAHLPDDLMSANFAGTIMHISTVFIIGIALGFIYILTRNVFYAILIHGVLNFISFSRPLVILISESTLSLTFDIIYWTIFTIGCGVLFVGLWQYYRKRNAEWVSLIRKKNTVPILAGSFGFLIMGIIGIFIPFIIQNVVIDLEIAIYSVLLYFFVLIICYGAFLVLFLWLGTRKIYELKII